VREIVERDLPDALGVQQSARAVGKLSVTSIDPTAGTRPAVRVEQSEATSWKEDWS